jgi:hypothetical protein
MYPRSNGGRSCDKLQMIHFGDIQARPVPYQFLAFAEAYLETAHGQCALIAGTPGEFTFAHGAVVLSLTYHGIELFLKGAILQRAPNEQFRGRLGHDLKHLKKRYTNLFPGETHELFLPFSTEEPDISDIDPRIAKELLTQIQNHDRVTPPDQVHRYPTDASGTPWKGHFGFIPSSFLHDISNVQAEIKRLKPVLFPQLVASHLKPINAYVLVKNKREGNALPRRRKPRR